MGVELVVSKIFVLKLVIVYSNYELSICLVCFLLQLLLLGVCDIAHQVNELWLDMARLVATAIQSCSL